MRKKLQILNQSISGYALSLVFVMLTATAMAVNDSTINIDQQLELSRQLQKEGNLDDSYDVCDSLHVRMDRDFYRQYDNEVVPVRLEYQTQERRVDANKERTVLIVKIGVVFLILSILGGVLIYYVRKQNKKVAKSADELRLATEQAKFAEKSKSMFLSNMTHEIRTPLNAIAGFSDVLTYDDLDPEFRKEVSDIIEMNSKLLQNLINDVVNTACTDLREMKFRIVACDVVKLCRNVTEIITKIKSTDAEMYFETTTDRLVVMVDPLRLQQVLVNVLVNATKFCKRGSIVLSFDCDEKDFRVSVTDTGIGIPKDKQASVFKRFERVKENAEGFGLGLSICQFIIESFDGKIWVDSEYTRGARFVFSVPIKTEVEGQEGGMVC